MFSVRHHLSPRERKQALVGKENLLSLGLETNLSGDASRQGGPCECRGGDRALRGEGISTEVVLDSPGGGRGSDLPHLGSGRGSESSTGQPLPRDGRESKTPTWNGGANGPW